MEIKFFDIPGLVEFIPRIHGDSRGYFFESYREDVLKKAGISSQFVQDNQSYSTLGVLRGLHYQKAPFAQAKLVRVITGKVLDIAVDIRTGSPTFGKWQGVVLDAALGNSFYVPEGFAHGFYTIEDAIFSYKCTHYYNKESEGGLLWNDPALGIEWNAENPLVSDKDLTLPLLSQMAPAFEF